MILCSPYATEMLQRSTAETEPEPAAMSVPKTSPEPIITSEPELNGKPDQVTPSVPEGVLVKDVDMKWSPTHTPAAEGELQLASEIFDVFEEGEPLFLPSLLFLSSPESAESPTSPESLASPLVLPSSCTPVFSSLPLSPTLPDPACSSALPLLVSVSRPAHPQPRLTLYDFGQVWSSETNFENPKRFL